MRIYPGDNRIVIDTQLAEGDIPLAYISTESDGHKVAISPLAGFDRDQRQEVIPYYTLLPSRDIYLFDKSDTLIPGTPDRMLASGDKFIYAPPNLTSFRPQRFNYSVVGKKHMKYRSDRSYDLRISCVDDSTEMAFAKKLMRLFGDAPRRGLCPENFSVNHRDLSIESLMNASMEDCDFVFIESSDGITYKGTGIPIEYDDYLDAHANVWVILDTPGFPEEAPLSLADQANFAVADPAVYVVKNFSSSARFSVPEAQPEDRTYHNPFSSTDCPVLLVEHFNKGFVLFSHSSLLEEMPANTSIFYELLARVYFDTYLETATVNEWITDTPPDYISAEGRLLQKSGFANSVELSKAFSLDATEVTPAKVKIDAENIVVVGQTANHIEFKKNFASPYAGYADPVKPEGAIAVYTPRQEIIYFDSMVYTLTEDISDKIIKKVTDEEISITIRPFRNSLSRISFSQDVTVRIPLYETRNYKRVRLESERFHLCIQAGIPGYVKEGDYQPGKDGAAIAKLTVAPRESETALFDMRQRGGGLPENVPPDYSLLDIGHVLGRLYRPAGALILRLPKRLEPHKEIVLDALKRHMVAEELPIILFE